MEISEWKNKFIRYLEDHPTSDKSHDIGHFKRVWKTSVKLIEDDADLLTILAACFFHDIISYPKNHPDRAFSSTHAAIRAEEILISLEFPSENLEDVKHCIEAHSFSANVKPKTIEAKIVQDADRMEALGAIGLARTFYVAGRLGSDLFNERDPLGMERELDDKKYALDHFKVKLLNLPNTMQTKAGRVEAFKRANVLVRFTEDLLSEL